MIELTKYEHACLFLNKDGVRLVIDPGCFTKLPGDLSDIAVIIITEEHRDHMDVDNLQTILAASPDAQIFTSEVANAALAEAHIASTPIKGAATIEVAGYTLTFDETDHAPTYIHSPCRSLSLTVDDYLYYPGDSYNTTSDAVEILALPTSGPWHKLSEAIDFANEIKSRRILATHNYLYSDDGNAVANSFIKMNLADQSREFVYLEVGESLT